MPDPGDRRFLAALEGLRGIAALAIVAHHLRQQVAILLDGVSPGGADLVAPLLENARFGVDLFFILSGFILCHVYLGARAPVTLPAWRRYLLFRIARIFPLHLFLLALWVAYTLLLVTFVHPEQSFHQRTGGLGELVERIFLVQMWWHGKTPLVLNVPDWSISVEWALYLVFPALVLAILRVARDRDSEGRALLPLGATLVLLAVFFAAAYGVIVVQKSGVYGYGYIWLFRGGCDFLIGTALWQLWARGYGADGRWRRIGVPLALIAILLACYLAERDWWVLPGLALLLFAETGRSLDPKSPGGLLARPAALWLGRMSYALYLGHWLVLQVVVGTVKYGGGRLLGDDPWSVAPLATSMLVILAVLALSLVFAALLHRWIEVPARRRLRALAAPRDEETKHE